MANIVNDILIIKNYFTVKDYTFRIIPFSGYIKCAAPCAAKPHLPTHLLHT